MNKLLVATLLLIVSGLSHADQSRSVSDDDKELCEAASYFAGLAFEGRQKGEDKKGYLEVINDDDDRDIPRSKRGYFKKLLNEAYNKPIYSSEEEMKSLLMKFHDDTYRDCMKKASR